MKSRIMKLTIGETEERNKEKRKRETVNSTDILCKFVK